MTKTDHRCQIALSVFMAVTLLPLNGMIMNPSTPQFPSMGRSFSSSSSRINAVSGSISNINIVGENLPDRQQAEPTVAVDPRNPSILVAGAQDLRLKALGHHRWHGYYRSTDAGQTWSSSLLPGFPGDNTPAGIASSLHSSNATSDPVLAFDGSGNVYYTGIAFNISDTTGNIGVGMVAFVAKYANDGADYDGVILIKGPLNADKPWIAVDTSPGPSNGNVYVAFDANLTATSSFASMLTRSTDGGKTFSTPFYTPSDMTGELPGLTVDALGNVYVSTDAFNPETGRPLNYVQVTKITNGGTSIAQNVRVVVSANLLPSPLPGAGFRTFTIPQVSSDAKGVYLVWDDYGLGNANVFMTRSTDEGSTWTTPVRINDDLAGQHFFPTVAASGGIINVAWYDSRLSGSSIIRVLDVFHAYSLNGGVTFSNNTRVTTVSFDPNKVLRSDAPNYNEPFIGDYIQVAATATAAHLVWTDNRFACDTVDNTYGCVDQDAFTAAIGLPDFTISVTPRPLSLIQGQTGTSNVSVTSVNGLYGNVTITSSSSPEGLPITQLEAATLLSQGKTRSFNLIFSPTLSTPNRIYTVSVIGASGFRVHSAELSVAVQPYQPKSGSMPSGNSDTLVRYVGLGALIVSGSLAGLVFLRRSRRNRIQESEIPLLLWSAKDRVTRLILRTLLTRP